ncbi:MAG: TMEM175 family protein [Halorientalis sp.]
MDDLTARETAETARLLALSDGVIAIAITLLALEISVPTVPADASPAVLTAQVLAQWEDFLGFALSFLVIGLYWVMHRRVFTHIETQTRGLVWLNLLFLLFVAFLPYATALFSAYPTRFGIAFYAAVLALTGYSLALLWLYATHEELVHTDLSTRARRLQLARYVVTPTVFVLSIPLSYWSPLAAIASWGLVLPINGAFETRLLGDTDDV